MKPIYEPSHDISNIINLGSGGNRIINAFEFSNDKEWVNYDREESWTELESEFVEPCRIQEEFMDHMAKAQDNTFLHMIKIPGIYTCSRINPTSKGLIRANKEQTKALGRYAYHCAKSAIGISPSRKEMANNAFAKIKGTISEAIEKVKSLHNEMIEDWNLSEEEKTFTGEIRDYYIARLTDLQDSRAEVLRRINTNVS